MGVTDIAETECESLSPRVAVMPREGAQRLAGIQYAAAYRFNH